MFLIASRNCNSHFNLFFYHFLNSLFPSLTHPITTLHTPPMTFSNDFCIPYSRKNSFQHSTLKLPVNCFYVLFFFPFSYSNDFSSFPLFSYVLFSPWHSFKVQFSIWKMCTRKKMYNKKVSWILKIHMCLKLATDNVGISRIEGDATITTK